MEAVRKTRLRVGVFADSAFQPRWLVDALSKAGATDFAEVAVVAIAPAHGGTEAPLLWRAYRGIDQALFGSEYRWSEPRDLNMLVGSERRLAIAPGDRAWRARLADARLDVAIALGDVDDAALEDVARHGVWRFCFGSAQSTCEPMAAVRDVLDGNPVMASGIRIHRPGKPDRLAYQSWARTFDFSVARSRDAIFAKTAEFLARALRDLHAGGTQWVEQGTEPAQAAAAVHVFPGSLGVLRDVTRMGARVARRAAQKALTVDEWRIAYRFGGSDDWNGSLDGFFHLESPKGAFWADPFPIQVQGRNYIFFEELPYGSDKAHISVVEVDREGRASTPVKVLERDYHLSYPFLVEEEGQLYMIPETAHNGTVEIYRCTDFPTKWKLERVLLKGLTCADATVHHDGKRWWMFANAAPVPGAEINDELHIFSAERLMGDWEPHRRNPVKSDVRSARPAGRLFWRGNRLYRPGQICAPLYGAGIALHRVERLTVDEYVESEESRILPRSDSVLGIHTMNRAGDLAVTDAFVRRPRF